MGQSSTKVDAKSDGKAGPTEMGGGRGAAESAPPAGRRRGVPRLVLLPLLAAVLIAAAYFGYGYLQDQARYVSTENAQVAGALIQVGSLNAGQVSSVAVDIGERVSKGQTVATISLPSSLGATGGGTPKMGFFGTDDQQVSVKAPIDGIVVSRSSNPGDTVGAGQPMFALVDPTRLWVQAQIEETKIGLIRPGQPVEVTVDTLGGPVPGRVLAVDRATSGTFSLLPQGNTSGNFNKVTQLIPVKIAIDYGQLPLVIGSSASVKIRVRE